MSILRAASLIAMLSLMSKFIGLARDKSIAYYCGLSAVTDAYNVAYLIPGVFGVLMLGGLNGPFHSAIVSTLSKAHKEKDATAFRVVLWTVIISTLGIMGGISCLFYFFAADIIGLWNLPSQTQRLAVIQFRIMSPMFLFSGIIGILYGVLSLRKQFATPTLSPIMASSAIILALLIFADPSHPEQLAATLAWGTMIGAFFQMVLQLFPLFSSLRPLPVLFDFNHPTYRTLLLILIPAVLSSTVGQVNSFIIYFFTGSMAEGAISAFQLANRLIQLPLGILLTALLVPLLPILSESANADDNHKSLIAKLNQGLRPVLMISIPVTIFLMIFGRSAIAFLFEGGQFNASDTQLTLEVLIYLSLSVVIYAIRDVLVRVFYALHDSKIPFYTTFVSIAVMFLFSWLLAPRMQVSGVALAASIATLFNFLTLAVILNKKIGSWIQSETWLHLRNILIAILPMLGAGLFVYQYLLRIEGHLMLLGQSALIGGLLAASYFGVLILLKDPEINRLTPIIKRVFKRLQKNKEI